MGLRTILGLKKNKPSSPSNESYSQEGEDVLLQRIFENVTDGFFIDVGAHHPINYSNTYKLYKLGWRGINIDAMPGSMKPFSIVRPLDTNLELPVSDVSESIPFYIFNEPALNTFSSELAQEYSKKDIYNIEQTAILETKTLKDILDKHLPQGQSIDFLSVDAEGFDYKVLISNDWNKYRPKVVLLENDLPVLELLKSDLYQFMVNNQYEFFTKTLKTVFFKEKNFNI